MDMTSFYWQSYITVERQQEIVNWVRSLDENQAHMIEQLRQDSRDYGYEECKEEYGDGPSQ